MAGRFRGKGRSRGRPTSAFGRIGKIRGASDDESDVNQALTDKVKRYRSDPFVPVQFGWYHGSVVPFWQRDDRAFLIL